MPTNTSDVDGRFPTAGPDSGTYDRYRVETTDDGAVRIHDSEAEDAWIQATAAVSLEDCR